MRYRLRTLLIVLAIGPMALAWGWSAYQEYMRRQNTVLPPPSNVLNFGGVTPRIIAQPEEVQKLRLLPPEEWP